VGLEVLEICTVSVGGVLREGVLIEYLDHL